MRLYFVINSSSNKCICIFILFNAIVCLLALKDKGAKPGSTALDCEMHFQIWIFRKPTSGCSPYCAMGVDSCCKRNSHTSGIAIPHLRNITMETLTFNVLFWHWIMRVHGCLKKINSFPGVYYDWCKSFCGIVCTVRYTQPNPFLCIERKCFFIIIKSCLIYLILSLNPHGLNILFCSA